MDYYSEENITKLSPREHVRKRPGMYIGGKGIHALHHMVNEVISYMVEEVILGRCTHIALELRDNHIIHINDNSEGLSLDHYKDTDLTKMEALLQEVAYENGQHRIICGLYGTQLIFVNALTSSMTVENRRDGYVWQQEYQQGIPQTKLTKVRELGEDGTGMSFTFSPDFTILDKNDFDREKIRHRCRELAYLLPDLTMTVRDVRSGASFEEVLHFPEGLKTLVEDLNSGAAPLHDTIHLHDEVVVKTTPDGPDLTVKIEVAFQFSNGDDTHIRGYINTIETSEDGGTHVAALEAALLSSLNEHGRFKLRDDFPLTWAEIERGLSAAVAVYHPDPQFVGNMKYQLANYETYDPIEGLIFSNFQRNYKTIDQINEHFLARRQQ